MNAYDTRMALLTEQSNLLNEQAGIGADLPEMQRDRTEANLRLGEIQRRNNGRPDTAEMQAAQLAADAHDEALANAHARLKAIAERLAEIRLQLGEPLALSEKEIRSHLKSVVLAAERVSKLEGAVETQADIIGKLASVPDCREALADQRAEIQASLLTGDSTQADLDRFDAEAASKVQAAESQAKALADAQAVGEVLARKLAEARQKLAGLAPLTVECQLSIIGAELTSAIIAHAEAETAWLGATNRRIGLEYLLRQGGRNPPPMSRREPLPMQQAAAAERDRLKAAHPDLFA